MTNVSAAALLSGHLDEGAAILEKSKVAFFSNSNASRAAIVMRSSITMVRSFFILGDWMKLRIC